jgi:Holliday junction resolvase
MTTTKTKNPEPGDVLYRVKRGLSAYVSYLAACEMNQAFSEYVLYEPILRILTARGFTVECEYECPGVQHAAQGDRKRIDFYATGHSVELAIEVKWAKSNKPNIDGDMKKLEAFAKARPNSVPLLCVFGRKTHLEGLQLGKARLKERGEFRYADLGKTKYGCRVYELKITSKGKREA